MPGSENTPIVYTRDINHWLVNVKWQTTLPILFQRQAAAKAEDLHQNGIDIELMSMNRHSHTFDDDQFYKDILFTDDDENTVRPDPADKFDELMSKYVIVDRMWLKSKRSMSDHLS